MKFNLISIVCKSFVPTHIPALLLHYIIVIKMTFLYNLPNKSYNYFLMQFYFKSYWRKKLQTENKVILFFIFIFVVTFTRALHFFMWICFTVQCLFVSSERVPFSISYRSCQRVTNSLLCSSGILSIIIIII